MKPRWENKWSDVRTATMGRLLEWASLEETARLNFSAIRKEASEQRKTQEIRRRILRKLVHRLNHATFFDSA
jgi:hypothetical protein